MLALCGAGAAHAAYEVNGVALGASEEDIRAAFPQAHCQPLEWASRAAERRCDDSRARYGDIDASVTFYLGRDAVQGIEVRFDRRELDRVAALLRKRYGTPALEGATPRRLEWKGDGERAVLRDETSSRRASLFFWRGSFYQDLYRLR